MTPNLKPLVTLRVKDGVAYVSEMKEPIKEKYGYHTSNSFDDEPTGWLIEGGEQAYYELLKVFDASFVQVANPEILTAWPFGNEVDKAFHHALYKPVDGTYDVSDKHIVFEVKKQYYTGVGFGKGEHPSMLWADVTDLTGDVLFSETRNVAICSLPEKKGVGIDEESKVRQFAKDLGEKMFPDDVNRAYDYRCGAYDGIMQYLNTKPL